MVLRGEKQEELKNIILFTFILSKEMKSQEWLVKARGCAVIAGVDDKWSMSKG